ncbi:TIP41-like protein, partial [Lemmus lemmus]
DANDAEPAAGPGSKINRGGRAGPRRGGRGRSRDGNGQTREPRFSEGRAVTAAAGTCYEWLCGASSAMMIHGFQSSHQDFSFGPWKLTAAKTHIMKSADVEKLADELHMPSLPEMMFGDNVLRIQHGSGFGINNYQGMLKVACAEEWQESRTEGEHSKEVIKPYDWTYTTDYKGTLLGESLKLKVVPTTDHIDTEKLKAREQIKFFEEVLLFEDELHDHGVSSFFLLLRFFLRIDGVLIRMNDTRLYHEADKTYMLREYTSRESKIANLMHVPPSLFTEPNEISQYLPIKEAVCEKLIFPERIDPNPADSQNTPSE